MARGGATGDGVPGGEGPLLQAAGLSLRSLRGRVVNLSIAEGRSVIQ